MARVSSPSHRGKTRQVDGVSVGHPGGEHASAFGAACRASPPRHVIPLLNAMRPIRARCPGVDPRATGTISIGGRVGGCEMLSTGRLLMVLPLHGLTRVCHNFAALEGPWMASATSDRMPRVQDRNEALHVRISYSGPRAGSSLR